MVDELSCWDLCDVAGELARVSDFNKADVEGMLQHALALQSLGVPMTAKGAEAMRAYHVQKLHLLPPDRLCILTVILRDELARHRH